MLYFKRMLLCEVVSFKRTDPRIQWHAPIEELKLSSEAFLGGGKHKCCMNKISTRDDPQVNTNIFPVKMSLSTN